MLFKVDEKEAREVLTEMSVNPHSRDVFFAFKDEDSCKFQESHEFSLSTGLELAVREDVVLETGESAVVPTGVRWAATYVYGWYLSILPRSGLMLNVPVIIPNAPATIEASYRGEIGVIFRALPSLKDVNWKGVKVAGGRIIIPKGTRVAQAVILSNLMACPVHSGVGTAKQESIVVPQNIYYCISEKIFKELPALAPSVRGEGGYGSTGTK
jgi:dUTP pyrophosphatase